MGHLLRRHPIRKSSVAETSWERAERHVLTSSPSPMGASDWDRDFFWSRSCFQELTSWPEIRSECTIWGLEPSGPASIPTYRLRFENWNQQSKRDGVEGRVQIKEYTHEKLLLHSSYMDKLNMRLRWQKRTEQWRPMAWKESKKSNQQRQRQ